MTPNWTKKFWKFERKAKHQGIYTKRYADGRQKRRNRK